MGKIITIVIVLVVAVLLANYYGYVDIPYLDLPTSSEQTYSNTYDGSSPESGQARQANQQKHKAIDNAFAK